MTFLMCGRVLPGTEPVMVRRFISREEVPLRKETGGTKTKARSGKSMFEAREESSAGSAART